MSVESGSTAFDKTDAPQDWALRELAQRIVLVAFP
jgi:hypothetical protein